MCGSAVRMLAGVSGFLTVFNWVLWSLGSFCPKKQILIRTETKEQNYRGINELENKEHKNI